MAKQLRVGIIGCGGVTQAIHRPTLLGLTDMFSIEACTDNWGEDVELFAASTGARVCSDPLAMIADDSIDVVLVAAPDAYHAEYVMAACEGRKRAVLVEKPFAMNVRMAKEVAAMVERSLTAVVVGYPHLFDPAVEQAQRHWAGRAPALGEFRTILGPNADFISDIAQLSPASGESPLVRNLTYALAASEPLGADIGLAEVQSFAYAIGLNIHDIPVMRRLLGEPDDITFAERFGENGLHVGFRYGRGRVYLTSLMQKEREIDWGFTLRGKDCTVSVDYPSTYSVSASSECTVSRGANNGIERLRWEGSYVTGFRREWQHVHAAALAGPGYTESISHALRDLEICEEILKRLIK